jgi:hypothetical protein
MEGSSNYNPLMMRRLAFALAAAAALHAAAPAASAPAEATARTTRTVPLPPGGAVQVDTTIADLTIVGSNRPDVAIEIVRRAPSDADLETFAPSVTVAGDLVRISAVQRGDRRDARLRSDMVIRAPAAADFRSVRVFEGRVRVSGLQTACDIDLRRGTIEAASLSGRVRLESGIGGVAVKDATLTPGGMLRVRVFNGPLTLQFAQPPANARILAVTLNGAIASDIPLRTKDQFGPRFGETTIGSGEPVVSLDVVKGDITISVGRR